MPIDRELLAVLACPVDRGAMREDGEHLRCATCSRRYAVRDGIPIMLPEEADPPA